jgi:hypothetical protein
MPILSRQNSYWATLTLLDNARGSSRLMSAINTRCNSSQLAPTLKQTHPSSNATWALPLEARRSPSQLLQGET